MFENIIDKYLQRYLIYN